VRWKLSLLTGRSRQLSYWEIYRADPPATLGLSFFSSAGKKKHARSFAVIGLLKSSSKRSWISFRVKFSSDSGPIVSRIDKSKSEN